MSRLIDADALLEEIGEEPMNWTNSPEEIQEYCDWKQTVAIINSAPTIEAEPVRHGHWNGWITTHWTKKYDDNGDPIYKEHTYYVCSGCRRRTIIKSAYCPACGRMMDEVSE